MINLLKFNNISAATKVYLVNSALYLAVLFSVILMFFIQFKVDNIQRNVDVSNNKIDDLEDEIRVLEVEWVYLTRPARLRDLSQKYLKNNQYVAANQIKDALTLQKYYLAKAKERDDLVMR
ncbi:MAG: hypothetical protein ACJAW3_000401 [Lentimonas sp.]|jgi:hypothetical protein